MLLDKLLRVNFVKVDSGWITRISGRSDTKAELMFTDVIDGWYKATAKSPN